MLPAEIYPPTQDFVIGVVKFFFSRECILRGYNYSKKIQFQRTHHKRNSSEFITLIPIESV